LSFTHSEESKLLISKHHRRIQTDDTRKKISELQIGKKFPKWRKYLLSNSLNNVSIAIYNSLMDAERATGVRNGNISSCVKGRCKTDGGYIWKLYKEKR